MPKFRKRPVVSEAEQWWPGKRVEGVCQTKDAPGIDYLQPRVQTLEGVLYISPGDWSGKGVQGGYYPVKDDIFRATYEPGGEV